MSNINDLMQALLMKTQEKKLLWNTDRGEDVWVKLGNSLVTIKSNDEDFFTQTFLADIRNANGLIVDSLEVSRGQDETLEKLYNAARKSAFRVDDTFDDILRALEKL